MDRRAGAEQTVRKPYEEDDQEDEGEEVAVGRAEKGDAIAFGETENRAAEDRAGDIADAANHLRDNPLERRLEAHGWIDVVVIHAHKQSPEAAER